MTDFNKLIKETISDFEAQASGQVKGYTSGLPDLDKMVGRMDKGQVWTLGGYTGTGKSFFIFNMIEGILEKEDAPKIIVFSTELDSKQYVKRHLFMRSGLWKLEFDNDPKQHLGTLKTTAQSYLEERIFSPESLNIEGDIYSLEQIDEALKEFDNETHPVMVFIDYLQELSAEGRFDEKDAMPIIAAKLKIMAKQHKCIIIAVSQVNGTDVSKDFDTIQKMPFSNGKQLNNASHVQIVLTREKQDGELLPILQVIVSKAREGQTGKLYYEILKGYNLNITTKDHATSLKKEVKDRTAQTITKNLFG